MIRTINRMLSPVRNRVRLMVGRCVLEVINDSTKAQSVQITGMADEVRDDVERFQNYGFSSVPYAGTEGIAVSVGGNRAHQVIVATEDRARRPTGLAEGDVALYNSNGVRCLLEQCNDLVLLGNAPTDFVALASLVQGELDKIQAAFDAHNHITTATIGPTGIPGTIAPPASPIGALSPITAAEVKAK